jgi:hypothetical protein
MDLRKVACLKSLTFTIVRQAIRDETGQDMSKLCTNSSWNADMIFPVAPKIFAVGYPEGRMESFAIISRPPNVKLKLSHKFIGKSVNFLSCAAYQWPI